MKLFFTRTEFMSGRIENMAVIDVTIMDAYKSEITNPTVMYDLIVAAITEWVETTEFGKKSWNETGKNFNVGDLADIVASEKHNLSLLPFLNSRAIKSIEVESAADNQMNYFDQVLCEAR